MKIMVRTDAKGRWQKVDEKTFERETELQLLLYSNLDLIPVEMLDAERRPIRVSVREAGLPGSGQTDLLGVDEDGNIVVVETKLASNQEIKRKVIGQILEYAAYLWQKPYEEFDSIVRARRGKGLIELMQEAEKDDEDWTSEDFRSAVAENLRVGRFGLFIVVDEINEELRRIIDFLNTNAGNLQLYALELKYFRTDGGEIVLPQIYGLTNELPAAASTPTWDEEQFRKRVETTVADIGMRTALLDLFQFLQTNGYHPKWGRGKDAGRVAFRIPHHQARDGFITVIRLKTDGGIKLGLGRITKELGEANGIETARTLLRTLGLPSFDQWAEQEYFVNGKSIKPGWPGKNRPITQLLPDADALKRLKEGLVKFRNLTAEKST